MQDPCRPGVKDAVRVCTAAGVKVVYYFQISTFIFYLIKMFIPSYVSRDDVLKTGVCYVQWSIKVTFFIQEKSIINKKCKRRKQRNILL